MRVSVAVMAHPSRAGMVADLLDRLDRPATVVWDQRSDRWDTGRRSWLAYDPTADYHLVVQDDAIVCRDLVAGLEQALPAVDGAPVCLYLGRVRPYQKAIDRVLRTVGDASWITMHEVCWGPAIALPTADVEAAVAVGDAHTEIVNYDIRIGRLFVEENRPTYYPWPSLVDHRDSPSLVGHGKRRWAHRFLGADVSALGHDWTGPVVEVTARELNMRVRMKVTLSGYRDRQPWPPMGGVVDLPVEEALDMVAVGQAEVVEEQPPQPPQPPVVEAAVVERPDVETAAVLAPPAPRPVKKAAPRKPRKKAAPRKATT